MKKQFLLFLLLTCSIAANAQVANWKTTVRGDNFLSVTSNKDYIWTNNEYSLQRINKQTGAVDKNLTIKTDSLPDPTNIASMSVDKNNVLWFTIYNVESIFKYDGKKIKEISKSTDGTPIDAIENIATDSKGNVWYNVSDKLYKFDGTTVKEVVNTANTNITGIPAINIDSKDNIWVSTYNGGTYKYNGITWETYAKLNSNVQTDWADFVVFAPNGKVCMGGGFGESSISILDGTKWELYKDTDTNSFMAGNPLYHIAYDDNNVLWAATEKGLYYLDNGAWKLENKVTIAVPTITSISKVVIAGTSKYIFYYNKGVKKLTNGVLTDAITPKNTDLPYDFIRSFAIDKNDNRYFSSASADLYKWSPTGVSKVTTNLSEDRTIRALNVDAKANLWIACSDSSVRRIDKNNVLTVFDKKQTKAIFIPRKIIVDKNDKVWYTTQDGYGYLENNVWTFVPRANISTSSPTVRDLLVDKNNLLWLATSNGLYTYNGTAYTKILKSDIGDFPFAFSLGLDGDNNVWVGTFVAHKWDYSKWTTDITDPNSPFYVTINKITYNKLDNKVYFATPEEGIFTYDTKTAKWGNFNAYNSPILSSGVTQIAFDSKNTKWFAGPGIYQYNEKGFVGANDDFTALTKIETFPNPSKDFIYLKGNLEYPVKCSVYDMEGKLMNQTELSDATQSINIQNYAAGTYFMNCTDKANKIAFGKIVKQ